MLVKEMSGMNFLFWRFKDFKNDDFYGFIDISYEKGFFSVFIGWVVLYK